MNYQLIDSPIGRLRLVSNGTHLVRIEFEGQQGNVGEDGLATDPVLEAACAQLRQYFAQARHSFELPLDPAGTPFQKSVWAALSQIPYGELRSYRDIAREIGNAAAVRAVGAANGRNPLPIVVPCHRVIGSDGSLTGFAGGLEAKTVLLQLEGAILV